MAHGVDFNISLKCTLDNAEATLDPVCSLQSVKIPSRTSHSRGLPEIDVTVGCMLSVYSSLTDQV